MASKLYIDEVIASNTSTGISFSGNAVFSKVITDEIAASNTSIKIKNNIIPENINVDLGSTSMSFRNIYTQDFILSNDNSDKPNSVDGTRGSWIIQEGENDLFIINNKTGKKYKFMLQEV